MMDQGFWANGSIGSEIRGLSGGAIRRRLKERERELLVYNAHIEVDKARAGYIDSNTFDREPKKELLSRNAGQVSDLAEADGAGDVEIVVDLVLELGVTGLVQPDMELACRRVM